MTSAAPNFAANSSGVPNRATTRWQHRHCAANFARYRTATSLPSGSGKSITQNENGHDPSLIM